MVATTVIPVFHQVREHAWPAQFTVESKSARYQGTAFTSATFSFVSDTPFDVAWLAELVIDCNGERLSMLANVTECQEATGGGHLTTAQPFALGGDDKVLWNRLVARTRLLASSRRY